MLAVALYGIVGGPGVGKTSIIKALEEKGEMTTREVATDYIVERKAQGSPAPWDEPGFQLEILKRTIERENQLMNQVDAQNEARIFSDRAILDLYVYLHIRNKIGTEEYQKGHEMIQLHRPVDRYRAIFYVLPWGDEKNDYHQIAQLRHEDYNEARELAKKTLEVYSDHFDALIEVPSNLTPEERADFVLQKVQEIEKKTVSSPLVKL